MIGIPNATRRMTDVKGPAKTGSIALDQKTDETSEEKGADLGIAAIVTGTETVTGGNVIRMGGMQEFVTEVAATTGTQTDEVIRSRVTGIAIVPGHRPETALETEHRQAGAREVIAETNVGTSETDLTMRQIQSIERIGQKVKWIWILTKQKRMTSTSLCDGAWDSRNSGAPRIQRFLETMPMVCERRRRRNIDST
jgi:hypothetical protein